MACCRVRNSSTSCNNVCVSGCYLSESSVERPELLALTPAICCTRADNQVVVLAGTDIPFTAVPFIGPNFSFTPTSTTMTITETGVYMINYSASASSAVAGDVAIGLRSNGVAVTGTTQSATIGAGETANLSGNYVLEVSSVPNTISLFNAGINATAYNNTVLSMFKIAQ